MEDYAKEIGSQIKTNAEVAGRARPNLMDAMLTADEYGVGKDVQMKHMRQVGSVEELALWRRGLLKEAQDKESHMLRRRILNNEVAQVDKLKQKDLDSFQQKLFG